MDESPPAESAHSLADLVRINRYLGGHEVLRKTLRRLFQPHESFSMLDVGAGSGDTGRVVQEEFPAARVTSLDYKVHHLARALPPRVAGNAFQLPVRNAGFDVVHCSLFMHHFENDQVVELMRGFGAAARLFVFINDLERNILAEHFVPATRWLFKWHAITVHDAPVSVAAGFKASELRQLAARAGFADIDVRVYRPAFRVALVAGVTRAQ